MHASDPLMQAPYNQTSPCPSIKQIYGKDALSFLSAH